MISAPAANANMAASTRSGIRKRSPAAAPNISALEAMPPSTSACTITTPYRPIPRTDTSN